MKRIIIKNLNAKSKAKCARIQNSIRSLKAKTRISSAIFADSLTRLLGAQANEQGRPGC